MSSNYTRVDVKRSSSCVFWSHVRYRWLPLLCHAAIRAASAHLVSSGGSAVAWMTDISHSNRHMPYIVGFWRHWTLQRCPYEHEEWTWAWHFPCWIKSKIKCKVQLPQATYTYAASSTLCVTDRAGVQPRAEPKPTLTDFGLQPYSLYT